MSIKIENIGNGFVKGSQTDEDLEKEIHTFWIREKRRGEIVDGSIDDFITVQQVARHFAQWGAEHLKK